jgi:Holliday junction resolvase RusA-like endonuclease
VDNLAASCKQMLDAMVRAGWLPDDDWKTVEAAWVSAKAKDKVSVGTAITIERLEERKGAEIYSV